MTQWIEDVKGRLHHVHGRLFIERNESEIVAYQEFSGSRIVNEIVLSRKPSLENWMRVRSQIGDGAHIISSPDYIIEHEGPVDPTLKPSESGGWARDFDNAILKSMIAGTVEKYGGKEDADDSEEE